MKILITTIGALAALSLLPAAAQKEKEQGKQAPALKTVDGGTVEKKIIGHWAPDPEAMLKEIQKSLGDDPEAAAALPLIQTLVQNMAMEVQKGQVTIHAMGEKQTATYRITKVDKAANKLTMQITDDEGVAEGSATIEEKKDGSKTLTLEKDSEKIVLNSITASEFEKRRNAAAQPPAFPGLE